MLSSIFVAHCYEATQTVFPDESARFIDDPDHLRRRGVSRVGLQLSGAVSVIRYRNPLPKPLAQRYNRGEMGAGQRIREHRDEILRVAALHGAGNVRLFGSVARGEDTAESDVDLLVDVTGDTTPWFPGSLTADLVQLLGRRVQVVIRRSLSPLIRDAVLRESVPL